MEFKDSRDFNRLRVAFDLIEPIEGMRVLNLGCGNNLFLEKEFRDRSVIGLDISPSALISRREENIQFENILADVRHLPFKDDSFDLVCMLAVLGCLPQMDIPDMIHEIYRVLNKDGHLLLIVSQKLFPYTLFRPDKIFNVPHCRHFEIKNLCYMLSLGQLHVKKVLFAGGILSLFESTLRLFYKFDMSYGLINRLMSNEFEIKENKNGRFAYILAQKGGILANGTISY